MCSKRAQRGLSLIEVVVFIVVLGIAFAGMLILFNQVTKASVDPLVRKQTLAIAASLLEEIELKPFTYCDPDEPAVYTATSASTAQCGGVASHVESIGAENFGAGNEDRYTAANRFDNVNDYHGFEMGSGTTSPGIFSVDDGGTPVAGLSDYAVRVSVAAAGTTLASIADNTAGLLITVTAQHVPTGTTVTLQGYRFRYAPNSP
jgi:MSHA pilin protein MshD